MTQNLVGREELPIIAIPITLKTFSRIVLSFQLEKLLELRIACQYLLGFCELMIRQVITSAAGDRQIDQAPKGIRRRFNSCRRMECEQIENDAGDRKSTRLNSSH